LWWFEKNQPQTRTNHKATQLQHRRVRPSALIFNSRPPSSLKTMAAPHASVAIQSDFLAQATTAMRKGEALVPLLEVMNVRSCAGLLALRPSFAAGTVAEADLTALAGTIQTATAKIPAWKGKALFTSTKEEEKFKAGLRAVIMEARTLALGVGTAIANALAIPTAATASAMPAAPTDAAEVAALKKRGQTQYVEAAEVFATSFPAHSRVRYEQVGRLNKNYLEGTPVGYGLADYGLQLKVGATKDESYTMFGQTFVAKEAHSKAAVLTTEADLLRQMERRAEAKAVAGCFSASDAAKKRGAPPPSGDDVYAKSVVSFVRSMTAMDGSKKMSAEERDCFATLAGQMLQVTAMRKFKERYPHVSVSKCVSIIDAGVEERIADLMLDGATADAAVYIACVKSPELFSAASCDGKDEKASSSAGDKDTPATESGDKSKKKTETEQLAGAKRRIADYEREVSKLKAGGGRGKGKGGGGNGMQGGRGGYGGYYNPYPPPWNFQGPAPGPPRNGPPPSGVQCPPDVCRDYNFKVQSCSNQSCRYKHVCALCGQNHPWRGNH
jgi:hypothetical protein